MSPFDVEPMDWVTCGRCRCVRPITVPKCPRCARLEALRVERFGELVLNMDAQERERDR